MVWSRGGDVVAVNSWQSRFGIVLIVVLGGNKHENDPEAGSPNTYFWSDDGLVWPVEGLRRSCHLALFGSPLNSASRASVARVRIDGASLVTSAATAWRGCQAV